MFAFTSVVALKESAYINNTVLFFRCASTAATRKTTKQRNSVIKTREMSAPLSLQTPPQQQSRPKKLQLIQLLGSTKQRGKSFDVASNQSTKVGRHSFGIASNYISRVIFLSLTSHHLSYLLHIIYFLPLSFTLIPTLLLFINLLFLLSPILFNSTFKFLSHQNPTIQK